MITHELSELEDDNLEDVEEDVVFIIRRILTTLIQKKDWRTTKFETLVACDDETRKLIIDGGSYINVVTAATV